MMDAIAEQRIEDKPPAEAPADTPVSAPASPDDIDQAIAEYEKAVPSPPKSEPNEQGQGLEQLGDEVADLLHDLDTSRHENGRLAELQGQLDSIHSELHRKAEIEAFDSFAGELQSRLPEHMPEDYARTQLLSMAASNPDLLVAWDYRNHDRRAADMEFTKLEALYAQVARDQSNDPRKAEVLNLLEQRGRQSGLIINSPKILQRAIADIERRARQHQPPDPILSADRAAVAFSMRGASAPVAPEPAPALGRMSENEFRDYTRKTFGF